MFKQRAQLESVVVKQQDAEPIRQLEQLLSKEASQAKLVGSNGEEVLIPEPVYHLLCDIVHMMASGQAIHLIPQNHEVSTQEAANVLNVSRPYLVKLLEEGEIPHTKVGKHRRIRFEDLMAYKKQRDKKRSQLLDKLIEMTEDADLYDYGE
ncbi:helix-turn-helix domain-containing protein [Microcoleus sp. FACHB-672]|uniref:helix-turn-helix domain-containing protein n=1 Tax=Microcoleus sp. FACHB-672 TaxID=2692825 RepID=UPI001681FF97|nr:helix-turn-helix domain-containing protein [Microcoleus sp. FACHB-672]MBD2039610.1 helix-turn-helix domain-containing protein [Microcoleus sp. FACHB-672]